MPSQDYFYDLSEKLEKEKFDYLILALEKNKKGDVAIGTMLFQLEDDDSIELMFKALTQFKRAVKKRKKSE
jgi:hypothetical protein